MRRGWADWRRSCRRPRDVADAYSALLGALRLTRALGSGNSILVTSAQPGEGKTTVSLCLALAASLAGQSTLLIDGDLRRSSLAMAVGSPGTVGLIEILMGEAEPAEAIRSVAASAGLPRTVGSISFMASGRKPAIFVTAVDWSRARDVFRSISQGFSLVILDSPPILAANDALLLASIIDAVVLVAGPGTTDRYEMRLAKEQLDAVGTPIIGAILNRFERKRHGRSSQPYGGYYRRSRT